MLLVLLIILQVFIFSVLVALFRKIMTKNVVSATQHLEEMNQDYLQKEHELNRQLEEARQKSEEMITGAQKEAEKLRMEIISRAEQERDNMLQQARVRSEEVVQQADKSRQQLLAEVDEKIAKEAVTKACELIEGTLPKEFKQLVHAHWVEDLIESGFSRLERLRIPDGVEETKIVSAFALTDEQRKRIAKKLGDSLGRQVKLKEEVDPKLVAGLVITIGSLVLDGSLDNKIREKAR
jgi:F0F1-type ATP synthase delta subunit